MTDHERGAYTPEADEPLSFDARRPSERRPFPMTLIGSVIVLFALIGGIALVYHGGVRGAGEAPRPVGEPVVSVKTAAAPSETREPASGADLYTAPKTAAASGPATTSETTTRQASAQVTTTAAPSGASAGQGSAGGSAPTFAAGPEQPAPRPAPQLRSLAALGGATARTERTQRTVTTMHSTSVGPSPVAGAPDDAEVDAAGVTTRSPHEADRSASVRLADATPPVRSRRPAGMVSEGAESEEGEAELGRLATRSLANRSLAGGSSIDRSVADRSLADRSTAAAATSRAVKPGGAVVQIGAFSSNTLADKGYADVASDMAGRMSGKAKHVLPLEVNGHMLYRTWLSGFASRADAIAFCEALRARNKACIVKG